VQINLFQNGVSQIVDRPQFLVGHQIAIVTLFQSQLHGKVTRPKSTKLSNAGTMNSIGLIPVVVGWMVTIQVSGIRYVGKK